MTSGRGPVVLALSLLALSSTSLAVSAGPNRPQWVRRYDGPVHSYDYGISTAVSPDGGRVFVTGSSEGRTTSLDYVTVAYDTASGKTDWFARWDRPAAGYDEAIALAVSPDGGRVFVTGFSEANGVRPADYATVAYDARTGAQLWTAIYDSADDLAIALAVSPDGQRVFVTGVAGPQGHVTTVAYAAADGKQLWVADGGVAGDGIAVAAGPDGSLVYVTGCSSPDCTDYLTQAYDVFTGAEVWDASYDGPARGQDFAIDLGISPDGGRVFVTGASLGRHGFAYATLAYDAHSGTSLWLSRYQGPGGSGSGEAAALGVSPDGSTVYVTGWITPPGGLAKYATVAYDSRDGSERWMATFHGPGAGYDEPDDLAVGPTGDRIYVTGIASAPSGSSGYGTVAYDAATGTQAWSALYLGPDPQEDDAYSIAASPDGQLVFVTGRSYGSRDADAATVAYRAYP
jgi:hypothetical protein